MVDFISMVCLNSMWIAWSHCTKCGSLVVWFTTHTYGGSPQSFIAHGCGPYSLTDILIIVTCYRNPPVFQRGCCLLWRSIPVMRVWSRYGPPISQLTSQWPASHHRTRSRWKTCLIYCIDTGLFEGINTQYVQRCPEARFHPGVCTWHIAKGAGSVTQHPQSSFNLDDIKP